MRDLRSFIMEEDGMGTVEVVLIVLVLAGLVVIFKKEITRVVREIVTKIDGKVSEAAAD
jgi:Flp pilus assembly pilin Flp